jgi:phenylacetate-coenzyme A ligase PaaK-like adenylate-forming protein
MLDTLRFIYHIRRFDNFVDYKLSNVLGVQKYLFRKIVRHAVRKSPYYRRKFKGVDLANCQPTDLPTLTKPEMMEHFDEIVTDRRVTRAKVEAFVADPANVGKYLLGKYVVCHTSGSQGQPALIVQDKYAFLLLFAMQAARGHAMPKSWNTLLDRLRNRTRWAIFLLRPGFYPSSVAFNYMPPPLKKLASIRFLRVSDPLEESIRHLNEFQPHIITAYAHVLENLAKAELAGKLQLRQAKNLQLLVSMSEPLYPDKREMIQDAFGVRVSNHYAMGECMGLSLGDPYTDGARLNPDLGLLEVVDAQNQPVPPGQPGSKVLVTNLYNRVQPIIRYEIDDVVTMRYVKGPESTFPVVETIAGRNNDRFWMKGDYGHRELPYFVFATIFHTLYEVAEYQIVQTGYNRFVFRLVPVAGKTIDPEKIRTLAQEKLALEHYLEPVDLQFQIIPEIEPDPRSGKVRRFVNQLGAPKVVTKGQHG